MREAHVHRTEWEQYLRGDLPAADLLRVDDHLRTCPGCREQLKVGEPETRGIREIRNDLDSPGHLEYEQMERFVDGGATVGERASVTGHAASCLWCKHELQDLAAYARS